MLVCYIAFFAFSQGAVIWVYIGEVFPESRARFRPKSWQLHTLGDGRNYFVWDFLPSPQNPAVTRSSFSR